MGDQPGRPGRLKLAKPAECEETTRANIPNPLDSIHDVLTGEILPPETARTTKNKGGRPPGPTKAVTDIRTLARKHGPAAIKRLKQLLTHDDPKVCVWAARELLDRGYGKAVSKAQSQVQSDVVIRIVH